MSIPIPSNKKSSDTSKSGPRRDSGSASASSSSSSSSSGPSVSDIAAALSQINEGKKNPKGLPSAEDPITISDEDLIEISEGVVSSLETDDHRAFLEMILFQGFIPLIWRRMLLNHLKKKLGENSKVIKFVCEALMVAVMRGTKITSKNFQKFKSTGQAVLNHMKSMSLQLSPESGSQGPSVITFQRFLAAFPYEVSAMLAQKAFQSNIIGVIPAYFPKCLCHSNSLALIPTEYDDSSALVVTLNAWRKDFTNVITKKALKDEDLVKSCNKFYTIIRDSQLYTEEQKEEYFVKVCAIEYSKLEYNDTGKATFLSYFSAAHQVAITTAMYE